MTTTRIIQREFVVQPGVDTLPAVTLGYAWSSFMNTYAVWPSNSGDSVTIRRSITLQAGYYYVTGTVDNYGTVNINGQYNIPLYNYDVNISRTTIANNTRIYHSGGLLTITISATNTGGPRGVAVTISKETVRYISTNEYISTVGDLVWSTRSPGTTSTGRYRVTMPFRAIITAHAWGGGGGGGGLDPEGGVGAPGLYNVNTFQVERGDILEVFVGAGGQLGQTTPGVGGSLGGTGGSSRLNIDNDSAKSFNGGTGGTAGLAGWSGGGGGGGGASGVLVNNSPALVAAGGGGGAGGGSYRDQNAGRQQASINNNATGNYAIGVKSLNIDNPSSYTNNAGAQVNNYTNFGSLTAPPAITGTTKVIVFGWGTIPANAQTRIIQTNAKVNLSSSNVLTFYVNKGTESDWGQIPDIGEDLHLEYSANGSSWSNITTVSRTVAANTWLIRSPQIPAGAKIAGGVFLRFRQTTQAASSSGKRDTWAMSGIWNGSLTLDFRGENGQTKGSPDGGGGGAGGGGYPGGQGGEVVSGDVPAFAGQCGGNYPDNVGATAGTNTSYYKAGFSAGGNYSANGQNGRVVLLIEPISLASVKVSGEWEQVQEAFVKVDGAWKDIDTIYIKINDTWKELSGAGQGDLTLVENNQAWGISTRSFS
jgi:hypothetical protein